jgi:hypothetical protein
MKPEQQRIKIAEACGYIRNDELDCWEKSNRYYFSCGDSRLAQLPDYLNDLNAMHEAKQVLWKNDWGYRCIFNDHLASIIKGRIVNRNEWDAETLLDATSGQQAEASLKTLGLWEEES